MPSSAAVRGATVALLAVLLAAIMPGTAWAAVDPTVRWASSESADLGVLDVSAASDSDIVALRAHLVSFTTGQEVAVVDDFALRSGTRQDGVWATPAPIRIATLGAYRVDVEATDADGDSVTATGVGTLNYTVAAGFDPLKLNRTTVDSAHRTVTVRGRLTGRWPTREVKPLAGLHVSLEVDFFEVQVVVTGADGRFSATVPLAAAGQVQAVYRPFVDQRSDITGGESAPVQIALRPAPTRLTATVDHTKVHEGGSFAVRGRLTARSGGGWHPLTGAQIGILFVPASGGSSVPIGQFSTDADGRYEATISPYEGGHAEVGFASGDPYQADATATTVEVHVAHISTVAVFTAVRADPETVTIFCGLGFPGGFTPVQPLIDVEFSRTGSTWTRVATRPGEWNGEGTGFTDSFPETRTGYWRIRYRGTVDFQPVVSDPILVPAA